MKREGSLKNGDLPIGLTKVILLEGEVYWQVQWMNPGFDSKNQIKYIVEESFERQTNLQLWDSTRFYQFKE